MVGKLSGMGPSAAHPLPNVLGECGARFCCPCSNFFSISLAPFLCHPEEESCQNSQERFFSHLKRYYSIDRSKRETNKCHTN